MDKLEEYIKKNREDLDKHDPSPNLWKEIRKSLQKGRSENIRWLSAAAMTAVILTTAALFYVWENKSNSVNTGRKNETFLMKFNPQLKETEIYYNNLVNELYNEASPMLASYPDLEKELFSDLSQLDSICEDIKNDLKDNIANQEVIEAMVNNYRIKIRILQDLLDLLRLNENDPEKDENHAL